MADRTSATSGSDEDPRADALALLATAARGGRSGVTTRVVTIAGATAGERRRVADTFVTELGEGVVRAECSRLTPSLGLGPLPEIVASLIGGADAPLPTHLDAEPSWMRAALEDVLGRSDDPRELGEIYAAVAHLIDADDRDRRVMVIEEVQRAGHGLLNLIGFLAMRRMRRGVLLVCTAAGGFPGRSLWPGSEEVDLGPEGGDKPDDTADDVADAGELAGSFEGRTHPELVGAHLERSGVNDEAAHYYARAGYLSLQRADMPSAADLLSRAARLLPAGNRDRLRALAASCDALLAIGMGDRVVEIAQAGQREATVAADSCMSARFAMWTALMAPAADDRTLRARLDDCAGALAVCDDDLGTAQVEEARAQLLWDEGETTASLGLMNDALDHARAARDRPTTARIVVWMLDHVLAGPPDIAEVVALGERLEWVAAWSALVDVKRRIVMAAAAAAGGRRDESVAAVESAARLQARLGQPGWVARVPQTAAWIALLGDDAGGAAERVRADFVELSAQGHPVAVDSGVVLARALVGLGRYDEAVDVALESGRHATSGIADFMGAAEVEAIRASALAHSGKEAETDVEALAKRLPGPGLPIRRGDALLDLADAAGVAGHIDRARRLCDDAIALYEAKRAVACTARARKALARFGRQV